MDREKLKLICERAKELADLKMDLLRCYWADLPTPTEYSTGKVSQARRESKGWSRGDMVAEILRCEFS